MGEVTVGRPRDASIDDKVVAAAIEQYAEGGWSAFTFESVARRAGVGKPAVYRRHVSREALLLSSMRHGTRNIETLDTGRLRDDLIVYARQALEFRMSTIGAAVHRIEADQRFHPELRQAFRSAYVRPMVEAARSIVERAQERGEFPVAASPVLVLEAVDGAVHTRVSSTNPDRWAELARTREEFVHELVDFALRGAGIETVAEVPS
jgi:AcrR family transcriptional regulator